MHGPIKQNKFQNQEQINELKKQDIRRQKQTHKLNEELKEHHIRLVLRYFPKLDPTRMRPDFIVLKKKRFGLDESLNFLEETNLLRSRTGPGKAKGKQEW